MKTVFLIVLFSPFLIRPGWADTARFPDSARVLSVNPVMETVPSLVSRRICRPPEGSAAIAGSVGRDILRQRRRWSLEGRCETVQEQGYRQRIDGYRVTYRYAGHTSSTYLDHDPGQRLPVRVMISMD